MHRTFRRSIPPSVRAIESASRRPTLCFVVRDDENKTGGMIVREKNLPAEVGKTQTSPRSASEVIAEMAAKVSHHSAARENENENDDEKAWERKIPSCTCIQNPENCFYHQLRNFCFAFYADKKAGQKLGWECLQNEDGEHGYELFLDMEKSNDDATRCYEKYDFFLWIRGFR